MANGNTGFDVNAARQAGYSDDEILSHLTQSRNFDVQGALSSGYNKSDIINHLASTSPLTTGGAGGSWEPQSPYGPVRAVKAFAGQVMQNAANPYGVSMATGAPVDINNPPQVHWQPPQSVGEFFQRVASPFKNEMQQVANQLTAYGPRSQGDYWTAGGQIAGNLLGFAMPQEPATGVSENAPLKWGGQPQGPLGSAGMYSQAGDKLSTVIKPISGQDMPALTHRTIPQLQESFADMGADPAAFTGRSGTTLLKTTAQNAINIHEDRAAQVMQPIINQPTPPRWLQGAPDLLEYLGTDSPTNAMINEARQEANKTLGRGNYFLKSPSKQINAPEAQIDAKAVAQQARNILYGQAEDATGIDLGPTRRNEADLINFSDAAHATHNALSLEQAKYESASPFTKLGGLAKAAVQVKTSPFSAAMQATERTPTYTSPTSKFNNVMTDIFKDVQAQPADRTFGGVRAPGMVSPVTPGGARMLPQDVAGYNTPVAGSTPFAPPGYQLGPAPQPTFPQTTIQGQPAGLRFQEPQLQRGPIIARPSPIPPPSALPGRPTPYGLLPGGNAPVYVEPTPTPISRLLQRTNPPVTRKR